jgi:hypothetical protein
MTLCFRVITLALALAVALPLHAADKQKPKPDESKPIDLVLCLDVSNSMDGLIDSAKLRLWDVVNEMGRLKPAPRLRVALYSYGADHYDSKIGWVKKDLDLTDDLDEVYKVLNGYRTNGGTEYVARVSKDALTQQKWSDGKGALKLIFVCGNEPVDQDKEVTLDSVADLAKKKGVLINTIYCGGAKDGDAPGWAAFAKKCGGQYLNVDMNRAAKQVDVKTEFDDQILELGVKLNKTYVAYGKDGKARAMNQTEQDKKAEGASKETALSRARSKAGSLYRNSTWDLVDRMKEKDFDVTKLKEEDLCDELKKIKPQERLAYLKKKAEERAAINKKIEELSVKRQKKVDEERAKSPKSTADKALDEALKGIVRDQAKSKGFQLDQGK